MSPLYAVKFSKQKWKAQTRNRQGTINKGCTRIIQREEGVNHKKDGNLKELLRTLPVLGKAEYVINIKMNIFLYEVLSKYIKYFNLSTLQKKSLLFPNHI